jgi:hypothetical protein
MSAERDDAQPEVDDLEVPRAQADDVKGGVATGDVTGDGPAAVAGDPDQPVVAARLPGLHKSTDVTLKRG